jgi:hypothetical protein
MEIAVPLGAQRLVGSSSFAPAERTTRPAPDPFSDFRDGLFRLLFEPTRAEAAPKGEMGSAVASSSFRET